MVLELLQLVELDRTHRIPTAILIIIPGALARITPGKLVWHMAQGMKDNEGFSTLAGSMRPYSRSACRFSPSNTSCQIAHTLRFVSTHNHTHSA